MQNRNLDFKQVFLDITKKLMLPAGESERFSSLENIERYSDEFIISVHDTWKEIHYKSIREIINIEKTLKSQNAKSFDKDFFWFLNHLKQLWRRVNDAIIWSIFHKRHIVKRLCLYCKRPPLIGANLDAEIKVLNDLNKNPFNIAILNDATYCVDIGDITLFNPKEHVFRHIEVKEGKVNEIITDIFSLNPHNKQFEEKAKSFFDTYGEKGFKQIERYYKQQKRNYQMIKLAENGKGYDPYTQQRIKIQESLVTDDYYDDMLNQLLEQAKEIKDGIIKIDDCLWIYTSYNLEYTLEDHKKRFIELIINSKPKDINYIISVFGNSEEGRIIPVNEWLSQHICIPFFLRRVSADNIAEIAIGKLLTRVFLYFDWNAFGNLFKYYNGEFCWSSRKAGRREKSQTWNKRLCIVIDDRIPQVNFKNGFFSISGANLIRILFDGLKPSIMAAQLSEVYNKQ